MMDQIKKMKMENKMENVNINCIKLPMINHLMIMMKTNDEKIQVKFNS